MVLTHGITVEVLLFEKHLRCKYLNENYCTYTTDILKYLF